MYVIKKSGSGSFRDETSRKLLHQKRSLLLRKKVKRRESLAAAARHLTKVEQAKLQLKTLTSCEQRCNPRHPWLSSIGHWNFFLRSRSLTPQEEVK
ncbi:hypothetical protein ACFOU2_03770 [Bacillus songklensis]|uniref:Uncharacterized protein n=1 Tax=Bacillus songklensis TaxID=1069116 RepID=A0ABV8AY99_9BACI